MKPVRLMPLLGAAVLAACVAETPRPPAPQPRPAPRPPIQAPPPPALEWQDLPLTPGAWSYDETGAGSQARFGPEGAEPGFVVRCDKARGEISLSRHGIATGNTMTVRTSFGARTLPLSIEAGATFVFAAIPATDSLLDNLAFSRGRFTVDVPGTATLVIPAWPEPARVIEDCRG